LDEKSSVAVETILLGYRSRCLIYFEVFFRSPVCGLRMDSKGALLFTIALLNKILLKFAYWRISKWVFYGTFDQELAAVVILVSNVFAIGFFHILSVDSNLKDP